MSSDTLSASSDYTKNINNIRNKKNKLKNSYYSNVSKMNILKKIHMEFI